METKLLSEIKSVLSAFPEYWNGEQLHKVKVIDDLREYKKELIEKLLANEKIRQAFSIELENGTVFKVEEFISMLRYKNYWDNSYTKYSNEIGLTSEGKYLKYNTDVVLDFPHKDCVLEGGMTKEDVGKKEIYYHKVLAKEEIDIMLSPKVFTNIKKYDKNGEHEVNGFDEEDNLIIKGNNLIALHTLKKRYARKVKLIYIDPPYNTGGDSFKYNDRFNHSTWLVFMKNRLSIARELLRDDGIIMVHCDKNEVHYLGILMNDIFGVNNYVETITIVNNPRGRDYGGIANMHEFLFVYKKSEKAKLNTIDDPDKEFPYTDEISGFELRELRNRNTAFHIENRPNLFYPVYVNPDSEDDNGLYEISLKRDSKHTVEVFPKKSQGIQTVWRWGRAKLQENINVNVKAKKMRDGSYQIVEKYRKSDRMARSVWWDKEVNGERGTIHLRELFKDKVFDFPKPETLMKRIIQIATDENDLVLDYHMGSGTTLTTALKMNRKFIGVEQMEYIKTVSVPRLQKVIEGEQGGISKEVNWQGGGSFVYAELYELNQKYVRQIQEAQSEKELEEVLEIVKEKAYHDLNVNIEKLTTANPDFTSLSLEEKKDILIQVLDANQLYLSYSEIDDAQYDIPESVKQFNHSFYKAVTEDEQ